MINSKIMSAVYGANAIAAAGLSANRTRIEVATANLANAESPGYKRRDAFQTAVPLAPANGSFSSVLDRKTLMAPSIMAVVEDDSPPQMQYQPNHPNADAQGYVAMPNVNVVETMTDMMSANRLYQANAVALQTSRDIAAEARKILTLA